MTRALALGGGDAWRVGGRTWASDGLRLWTGDGFTAGGDAPRFTAGGDAPPASLPRFTAGGDAPPATLPGFAPVAGVRQVLPDPAGVRIVAADGERRWGDDGRVSPPLPRAAAHRFGDLAVCVADGFVYATRGGRTRALDAVGPGERAFVGPAGSVVVEGPDGPRFGAPGRTPVPLPGDGPLRVADDGRRALRTPVAVGVDEVAGWLVRGRLRVGPAPRAASSARAGEVLAGPGGRVWDLARGRPLTPPGAVSLGFTVAVGDGFVTWDFETRIGREVGGSTSFALPLDPDDDVRGVAADGRDVLVSTVLGAGFRVRGGRVEPIPDPGLRQPRPKAREAPFGAFTGDAHGPWWWNDDGWLLRADP